MKRIPKHKITPERVSGMAKEIILMSNLCHPNVTMLFACTFDPYVCLILEFLENGSLSDLFPPKV